MWLTGWKVRKEQIIPEMNRCVMIASPHTSNWDYVYMIASLDILKIPYKVTVKKEWNKPIIGSWMTSLGAVWIDRTAKKVGVKRRSMVDVMVDVFKEHENIAMIITPEGTRSKRTEWKTGFYHIAKKAGVPICLSYVDYKKKESGLLGVVYPSDNMEADMKTIMKMYQQTTPKHPEKYSVDTRYL